MACAGATSGAGLASSAAVAPWVPSENAAVANKAPRMMDLNMIPPVFLVSARKSYLRTTRKALPSGRAGRNWLSIDTSLELPVGGALRYTGPGALPALGGHGGNLAADDALPGRGSRGRVFG